MAAVGQAQHFQGSQGRHLGAGQDNPAERKMFVLNLNVARNMKKEPEKVGGGTGGEEEEKTEGIRGREMRIQLLFRIWGQYLLNRHRGYQKESWTGWDILLHCLSKVLKVLLQNCLSKVLKVLLHNCLSKVFNHNPT